jgi:ABC-type multidrug transport system fused ATPase/permease subunit
MTHYSKTKVLISFFRRYKFQIIGLFTVGIISSILEILIPVALAKYYELVFDNSSPRAFIFDLLPSYLLETTPRFLLFFIIQILAFSLFNYADVFGRYALSEIFVYHIRKILFRNQLKINHSVYDSKGTGRYLLRYSGDLTGIQNYINKGIFQFFIDLLFLILTLSVLLAIDFGIFLIVFGFSIISLLFLVITNKWLNKYSITRRDQKSSLLTFVSTHLRSIIVIKSFNQERIVLKKFLKKAKKILFNGIYFQAINSAIKTSTKSVVYIMLWLVLIYVFLISKKSEGDLLIVILLLVSMLPVFRRILLVYSIWEIGDISFKKLFDVINSKKENDDEIEEDTKLTGNRIIVKNLSFKYEHKSVFHKLNISIPSKSITAISGSGKSTFAKLILGLYRNYSGVIKVNKTDIKFVPNKTLRKKVTVISSDWPLYGKNVLQAIANGANANKKKNVEALLEKLQLRWKADLTIDSPIGENGQLLSYNQYVLLCFARAIATNKKIILIDVFFQNLDPELRLHLVEMLNEFKLTKTIIVFSNNQIPDNLEIDQSFNLDEQQTAREWLKESNSTDNSFTDNA